MLNFQVIRSTNGNVTMSKTILNAINALKNARPVFSTEELTAAINERLYKDEALTETQVARTVKHFATEMAKGYRYNAMRGKIVDLGMNFYEYK